MKRVVYWALAVIMLTGLVIAPSMGCRGEEKVEEIALGTGVVADAPLDALTRGLVHAIGKQELGFRIIPHQNPGGTAEVVQNIDRYDFGGLSLDEAAQAYYGFYKWGGQSHPQLRLLWVMGSIPITFIAAANTGIESIYELDGKPVGSGEPESMTQFKAMKLFKALGIKPDWHQGSWEAQLDLYRQGELVGLVKEGAPDPTLSALWKERPFTVLDISETDLIQANQYYSGTGLIFPTRILRPNVYPGQEEMVITCGLVFGYFAHKDVSAELIYKLVKASWEEVWDISLCYEPMRLDIIGFPMLTLKQGPFPLHPGAIKLYQGLGLEVPSHLVPRDASRL